MRGGRGFSAGRPRPRDRLSGAVLPVDLLAFFVVVLSIGTALQWRKNACLASKPAHHTADTNGGQVPALLGIFLLFRNSLRPNKGGKQK